VSKCHADSLSTPIPIPTPTLILSAFLCLYLSAIETWARIPTSAARENVRMSYVVHAGARDAAFAEADCRQLTAPPSARWAGGAEDKR
jgi:hypothetical protein